MGGALRKSENEALIFSAPLFAFSILLRFALTTLSGKFCDTVATLSEALYRIDSAQSRGSALQSLSGRKANTEILRLHHSFPKGDFVEFIL